MSILNTKNYSYDLLETLLWGPDGTQFHGLLLTGPGSNFQTIFFQDCASSIEHFCEISAQWDLYSLWYNFLFRITKWHPQASPGTSVWTLITLQCIWRKWPFQGRYKKGATKFLKELSSPGNLQGSDPSGRLNLASIRHLLAQKTPDWYLANFTSGASFVHLRVIVNTVRSSLIHDEIPTYHFKMVTHSQSK